MLEQQITPTKKQNQSVLLPAMPLISLYGSHKSFQCSVLPVTSFDITTQYPLMNLTNEAENTHGLPAWSGQAELDGRIRLDNKNRNYFQLFWEGRKRADTPKSSRFSFMMSPDNERNEFFMVSKSDAEQFMDHFVRNVFHFNVKESNDFITLFLPQLQSSSFNLIQFLVNEQVENNVSRLMVEPQPDQVIRVYLMFEGFESREQLISKYNFTIIGDESLMYCNPEKNLYLSDVSGRIEDVEVPEHFKMNRVDNAEDLFTLTEWGGCNIGTSNLVLN